MDSFLIHFKRLFATRTSNGNFSCGRVNVFPQHVAILLARESKGTRGRINYIRLGSVRMTRRFGWLQITLLVLPSFSSFFQLPPATVNGNSWRNALLECSKRIFTVACVSRNLTIVLTSQLSTKMVKADGSAGSFDTGARAIMTPTLGKSNSHIWVAKHAASDLRTRLFLPAAVQGLSGYDNPTLTNLRASLSAVSLIRGVYVCEYMLTPSQGGMPVEFSCDRRGPRNSARRAVQDGKRWDFSLCIDGGN